MRNYGAKATWVFERGKVLQGLPADFDIPPFRVDAKVAAVGNGVPLPMGRAVAKAVKRALGLDDA
jgi:DNA (cytosine-5)-methyltransferase 1